jgi:hypothetical protein
MRLCLFFKTTVLQRTRRPSPKERKLANVSKRSFLAFQALPMLKPSPRLGMQRHDVEHHEFQEKFDVRNPQSDRLRVVERMHNSAMQCANPNCSKELLYLREGSLQMLELEPDSDDQSRQDEGAFAMKRQSSKFFWLCGECSKTHMVKQWTTSGPVLMLHKQKTAGNRPNLTEPAVAQMTQPLPVSLTVLPIPPMGHPLHRSASLVLRETFVGPKAC